MAQPRVTRYTPFVFDEIRRIGRAWRDVNVPDAPADVEFWFEKIGELAWRRLVDEKPLRQIFEEIGVDPTNYLPPEPEPLPVDREALLRRPRMGMNISGMLVNTQHDLTEIFLRFQDAGVELIDCNWLSALWAGVDCLPFKIPPAGQPFDLFDWNNQFFERAHEIRERANAFGMVAQGTFWETYSWSNRKKGSGIPDGNLGPWRNNVNGIQLGGAYNGDRREDDPALTQLIPTAFCREFVPKIAPIWDLTLNPCRLGNEMPEKSLHQRLRDLLRSVAPGALVVVNRQDDTPGQYVNMKIGRDYDFIEYHGRKAKTVADLTAPWSATESSVPTYQDMLDDDDTDPSRITFSSDGARVSDDPTNPYDWNALRAFFREVRRQGCSVLHQSRAKLTPAPNHDQIEVDWFKSLRS